MTLDLPTLMVMQGFALASAGAVVLFAWVQNRTIPALALWGLAHFCAAAGILSLMFGATQQQPIWFALGHALLPMQAGLIWKAARSVDGKPTALILVLIGPAAALCVGLPSLAMFSASVSIAVGAVYSFATAETLWSSRRERLAARLPLIVLCAVHGLVLLVGVYSTVNGSTGRDGVPSIASLFGFIYFESIIFALGTALFVLALVKERSEAAGRMAALIDPLTGITNRSGFMQNGGRLLQRCRHDGAPISVLMFDLDRFKAVNDSHGHAVGDAVIRNFCEVALAALRPSDVLGRLGGEEFAAVLPGSSIEAAYVRAERIRVAFAARCRIIGNRQIDATVSCGVAACPDASDTLDTLLEQADAALYNAKFDGRNRVKRASQAIAQKTVSTVIRVA
jgi:diguanylate cyclase (GGDEF)-like protein